METNSNSYRLDQGDKIYIFQTSIVGNMFRMSCQNSDDINNKKFTKDFTMEQFSGINKIFASIQTPLQASEIVDHILSQQKVGVVEENNIIKIIFYISDKGTKDKIEIELNDNFSSYSKSSNFQTDNIPDYNNYNYMGSTIETQNIYSQDNNNQDLNQYFPPIQNSSTNFYEFSSSSPNEFDINQFLQNNNKSYYDNPPVIGPVDDSAGQYFQSINQNNGYQNIQIEGYNTQSTQNFQTNEFYQASQNVNESKNEQFVSEYPATNQKSFEEMMGNNINTNIKEEDEFTKYFQQQNQDVNMNAEFNFGQLEQGQNEVEKSLKPMVTTKVLPIKTTARVLPVIRISEDPNKIDLHKLGMMNSEKQNNLNIPYQTYENYQESQNIQQSIQQNINPQPITINKNEKEIKAATKTSTQTTTQKTKETKSSNTKVIVKEKKIINSSAQKQKASEKKTIVTESEEIKVLKSQIAELEPLRKKISEMEVLRGQLTELNTLRAQVAEYNSIKGQIKEIPTLRNKIKELISENEQLKLKITKLEEINSKYEEELNTIKDLKEKEKLYSNRKSRGSYENGNDGDNNNENKELENDDNSEDNAVKGDIIHDTLELELLTKKINSNSNQKLTLNLLYKATADSDKAAAFHAKCDEANSTIVLIETDKGKRFGGYTTCSWSGDCVEKKDEEAFVFSLDKMMTYDNIPGDDAIGCYPKFGPIFLGCQIRIYDNAFSKGGTTFERGLNFDTQEDFELTGGDRVFNVKEIEVYEVLKE